MRMDAKVAGRGGLEGVVVAETRCSEVDGERGRLIIAGDDVEQLAGRISHEEVCARLWNASVAGDRWTAAEVQRAVGLARVSAAERLDSLGDALDRADGMDALRAAVAHLVAPADRALEPPLLVAAVAVYAAAWARRRRGLAPIPPDPDATHAADYLRLSDPDGAAASAARVRALDAYLVAVSDHGMNASTFTARVVASTASDGVSAIVAAIGALKGPLHGGAPGPVLDMLDAIGTPDRATAWLEAELAAGRRVMGMGHRIYRVRDPRAAVLEAAISALGGEGVPAAARRLALARAVEEAAVGVLRARHPDRPLQANVEFYTAVLLDAVGLDRAAFSPTFAVSRVAGWCAHVAEQRALGRLIRPEALYVGARPPAA